MTITKLLPPQPLRLMVYDTSDVSRRMSQLAPNVLDDVDVTVPIGLSHSWVAGGRLYKAARWIDECAGFDNWDAALHWLATYGAPRRISQIQIWGHGTPGKTWMGGKALTAVSPMRDDHQGLSLKAIAERMTGDGVIWLRNCSVFAGRRGHDFAETWADELDCRIAAHTHIIGPWQSGLHTLEPGEQPHWPLTEGIVEGTPDSPRRLAVSRPWSRNTVFMLRSEVPRGW